MMIDNQFCTFYIAEHFFGVPVTRVQEVLRSLDHTPVPLSEQEVSGLINLRGQIVTAIDLRVRLEFPPLEDESRPMNVVIRTEDGGVSFLVDSIGDVLVVDEGRIEEPPPTLQGVARNLVSKVCKFDDDLLLILDVDAVLGFAEMASV